MTPAKIPFAGPSISNAEILAVIDAVRNGWYENHGVHAGRFERMVARRVGVSHAIAVPHCTAALHLALAAMNIGPGDEVICPDVTWVASVAPVIYCGATPVLVDILPDTWCIDPAAVERAIGPRTRAVIGVDLYGSMCDWPALRELAGGHELWLVEDAAEAIGSTLNGRQAGSFGDAGAFSFHGSKTIATGEGGMFVTNHDSLCDRALVLRDHGRNGGLESEEIGFKYRMNAITAALGTAQMGRFDELIARKRQIFAWYCERLAGVDGVMLNAEPEGVQNSYWMATAIVDGWHSTNLVADLSHRNIASRPFFAPLSTQSAFADRPESRRFCTPRDAGLYPAAHGINLPSGYNMTEALVDRVCRTLREVIGR